MNWLEPPSNPEQNFEQKVLIYAVNMWFLNDLDEDTKKIALSYYQIVFIFFQSYLYDKNIEEKSIKNVCELIYRSILREDITTDKWALELKKQVSWLFRFYEVMRWKFISQSEIWLELYKTLLLNK